MIRAAARQRARQPKIVTLGAPVGGLNARDALENMPETDAVQLDNWFPDFGKVTVRRGSAVHAQVGVDADSVFVPETGAVETLAEWHGATGRKLLAAAGDAIWDVTAGGEIDTPLDDDFSNARWQHANMNDLLLMVNGEDTPQQYDGSTIADMTIAPKSGEPSLDVDTLIGVNVFKSRAYYWTGKDQDFWYSAVNAHAGDLELFPLGDVGSFGGHLLLMATWTRDGGSGMDDLAVFVMSSGEVIVYAGSDPGSADDWALVGVFKIGAPLGIRAWAKVGGDVLIATTEGYSLLSMALEGVAGTPGINISDKIINAALERAGATKGSFGWQVLHYPNGRQLLVNHPFSGGQFHQHVVNLGTGAWCRFKGLNSRCWVLFNDRPFFGGAGGQVWEADKGTKDGTANVVADARQAFAWLGDKRRNVQIKMVGPLMESATMIPVTFSVAADFNPLPAGQEQVTLGEESLGDSQWNAAVWNEAEWARASRGVQGWFAHNGRGYALSFGMKVTQANSRVSWTATRALIEPAGEI